MSQFHFSFAFYTTTQPHLWNFPLLSLLFKLIHSFISWYYACILEEKRMNTNVQKNQVRQEKKERKQWTKRKKKKGRRKVNFYFRCQQCLVGGEIGKVQEMCVCVKDRYKNRVVVGWRIIHCEKSIYSM